jgi:hypothetical protein
MPRKKVAAAAPTTEIVSPFVAPEITAATTETIPTPILVGQGLDPHVIVVDGWDKIVIPMNGVRVERIQEALISYVETDEDYAQAVDLLADLERVMPFVSDSHDIHDLEEMAATIRSEIEHWDQARKEVVDAT